MPPAWSKRTAFMEIPQSEAEAEAGMETLRSTRRQWSLRWFWIPIVFAVGVGLGGYLGNCLTRHMDGSCIRQISEFSPVTQDVDIVFGEKNFNGSLFNLNEFRQDAGPQVDKAWKALGVDYRAAIVPVELAEQSGLTPHHVQVNPKYGGGFPANVEGLHHLHCLNLLRQSLYYNFEYYHELGEGAFKNEDHVLKAHITHCLDTVRQQLMCTVDLGMLGQVWWDRESPQAYPDFNTRHTCRNFEAVRQWAETHQAPDDVPGDYLMGPVSEEAVYTSIP